ncbi:hypothetical protein DAETH_30250 [Deinococcus aetherius]|uniref:Uncharacterized protein n=1 Tax=Deinococcus aetherius TaxID=200252 RepID=A0ABM8AH40_9DEIO|nr:hypothetical protein [Deinococcus aetherius]BDP43056.1 hypothetical protein DAETH_30250 [Deinococcus aetherius]
MLDNILNSVRRGAGRVQRRGEEVAQIARLRLEVFQLTRELDLLYARLGRSYHAGADVGILQGIRDDIRRVDDEIGARERLMRELGGDHAEGGEPHPEDSADLLPVARPSAPESSPRVVITTARGTEPTIPDAMPRPQETRMTDRDPSVPTTHDPTVQHSDERPDLGDSTASQGNLPAREKGFINKHREEEGRAASEMPDPLDL